MKRILLVLLLLPLLTLGCKKLVDVELPQEAPSAKSTAYTDALMQLGTLSKQFGRAPINVQCEDGGVRDLTGAAQASGSEIPVDITDMVVSAVNRVGGAVRYIAYNPTYVRNMQTLKVTSGSNLAVPDLMITGGITEFDRSLESSGSGFDAGGKFGSGVQSAGFEFSNQSRDSSSAITVDLHLASFQTLSMVPRMQAVNTIKVFKAAKDMELGFTLFGATFGFKGSVKKIQGRHAALRILVEMSVVEILGKYLNVPYWKCVEGSRPDAVVLENIKDEFAAASPVQRISMIQKLLKVYGYPVSDTGAMDGATQQALSNVQSAYNIVASSMDEYFYEQLFVNVPVCGEQKRVQTASSGGMALPAPSAGGAPSAAPMAAQAAPLPAAAPMAVAAVATAPAAPAMAASSGPLQVKVWTDKKSYKQGEQIVVHVQGNKDFYGKLVNISSSGEIVQLLPNTYRNVDYFKAGRVYKVPDSGDAFALNVSPPFGQEKLVLYASEQPLGKTDMQPVGQGLSMFQGSKGDLDKKVRAISISSAPAGTMVSEAQAAPPPSAGKSVEVKEAMAEFVTTQ
jgi:hypothetical protein